ncbi:MAG: hypothetical protein V8T01_00930 [Oscillospiraceae bacterium]
MRFSTAEYYRRGIELHITPRIGDIPLKKLTGAICNGSTKTYRNMGGSVKRRRASNQD